MLVAPCSRQTLAIGGGFVVYTPRALPGQINALKINQLRETTVNTIAVFLHFHSVIAIMSPLRLLLLPLLLGVLPLPLGLPCLPRLIGGYHSVGRCPKLRSRAVQSLNCIVSPSMASACL